MKKGIFLLMNPLRYLIALFMIFAGVKHFTIVNMFVPMVPHWLPMPEMVVYVSGVLEIILGLMLFAKNKVATLGALLIFLMMVCYLPIHVADVFSTQPSISGFVSKGSDVHTVAVVRLIVQFLLIAVTFCVFWFLKRTQGCFCDGHCSTHISDSAPQ